MDDGTRKPKGLWFIGFIWIFMDLYGFIWIYELYRIIYELKLLGYHYMMGVQIVQTPWKNE